MPSQGAEALVGETGPEQGSEVADDKAPAPSSWKGRKGEVERLGAKEREGCSFTEGGREQLWAIEVLQTWV